MLPLELPGVFLGHQRHRDLVGRVLRGCQQAEEVNEVAALMRQADIGVNDGDLGCAPEVREQQRVVGDAALVFLEFTVTLE